MKQPRPEIYFAQKVIYNHYVGVPQCIVFNLNQQICGKFHVHKLNSKKGVSCSGFYFGVSKYKSRYSDYYSTRLVSIENGYMIYGGLRVSLDNREKKHKEHNRQVREIHGNV